jgi:hypothetical protein
VLYCGVPFIACLVWVEKAVQICDKHARVPISDMEKTFCQKCNSSTKYNEELSLIGRKKMIELLTWQYRGSY